jgi:hypothetical protein
MDWKRGQLKPIEIVPTADEFRTFFSPKFDSGTIELINRRKLTVYIITRVSYTDPGGHWFSDDCGSLLLPIELRSIQGKECEPQYNNKRYHPNE